MFVARRAAGKAEAPERGQALILLVFAMTVVFVAGAIAIDVGLWLSERRGAQTDADLPALAGAWELLDPAGGNQAEAEDAVGSWINGNNEQGNLTLHDLVVDDSCFDQGALDAVSVNVRHESVALFSKIFNLGNPNIGAHAKACAGAAQGAIGIIPFQKHDDDSACFDAQGEPRFGEFCPIGLRASSGNPNGVLDLSANGRCSDANAPTDVETMIAQGGEGNCLMNSGSGCSPVLGPWDDCVAVRAPNTEDLLDGLAQRLGSPPICDTDGDGRDELNESVSAVFGSGAGALYEARDCDTASNGKQTSSRLATIVVLEDEPVPGSNGVPILAFAAFYLAGCAEEDTDVNGWGDVDPTCARSSSGDDDDDDDHHEAVWGQFVNLVVTGATVGPPANPTTIFGISLAE